MFANESLHVVEDGYISLLATSMVSAICTIFEIVCAICFQDVHDLFMIFYLLLTVPWMFLSSGNANRDSQHKRYVSVWMGVWSAYSHTGVFPSMDFWPQSLP